MYVFRGRCAHDLYRRVWRTLLQEGETATVRGLPTRELLNVATVIDQPWRHTAMVPGRRLNPFLAMAESFWVLAGRRDLASIMPYNRRMADFSDDGKTLYGSNYGWRIKSQIEPVIARLRQEETDRRGVIVVWQEPDLMKVTKDAPCNLILFFKLRRGQLHMTVMNRSNDIHWGLFAVNIPEFGMLQEYMAARLGVGMGTQTHISNSLHVYLEGPAQDINKRMFAQWGESMPELAESDLLFTPPLPAHRQMVEEFGRVLDRNEPITGLHSLQFAVDYLRWCKHELAWYKIRHWDKHMDWITAGRYFRPKEEQKS